VDPGLEELDQWVSDAEVAEIPFTAFASRGKKGQVSARLIVRRVRDANPAHVITSEQGELFPVWRHHAVFTNSPLPMLAAEADHRRHAIIEQVIADLKSGPLAHLPEVILSWSLWQGCELRRCVADDVVDAVERVRDHEHVTCEILFVGVSRRAGRPVMSASRLCPRARASASLRSIAVRRSGWA